MDQSTPRRGRPFKAPAERLSSPILVRITAAELAALDAWIARQEGRVSRPEAMRRLLQTALSGDERQP